MMLSELFLNLYVDDIGWLVSIQTGLKIGGTYVIIFAVSGPGKARKQQDYQKKETRAGHNHDISSSVLFGQNDFVQNTLQTSTKQIVTWIL
jgi:hypothetical protein